MKTKFTLLMAAFLFSGLLIFSTAAQTVPPSGYNLTWSDEFDGSSMNTNNWDYRQLGERWDAVNVEDAVRVANGNLSIITYTENNTHYTGMIGTQNKFEQTFGYWEARIQFNDSPGSWSAFWVQSPTIGLVIGDPATSGTEIDIIEHRKHNASGVNIDNIVAHNLHWDGYGEFHQSASSGDIPFPGLQNGTWHTYGVLWDNQGYTFYVDGQQTYKTSKGLSKRSEYIILSTEVRNNNWAGKIPAGGYGSLESSTTIMNVDYVRVYAPANPPMEIVVENPSFELPGTGKLTDMLNVTGWNGPAGVETGFGSTEGAYHAYLGDAEEAYQLTDHVIASGEYYTLTVDLANTYYGTNLSIELYYDDAGTQVTMGSTTTLFSGSTSGPDEATLTVSSDDIAQSIGKQIGIRFYTTDGWVSVDNVRLLVEINPVSEIVVENPSFELPGTGKLTDMLNVTGWNGPAGVETGFGSTEGAYHAYFGNAEEAYQLTDHVIASGEYYTLTADLANTSNGTNLSIELYYDDAGTQVTMGSTTTLFSGSTSGSYEATLTVSSDDIAQSIGKQIGIRFYTTDGWISVDNVRLLVKINPFSEVVLVNPSFEVGAPTSELTVADHGWDGPGVPETDGLSQGNDQYALTDGSYYANPGPGEELSQLTGHTISTGESFTLIADVSSTWRVRIPMIIELYYYDDVTASNVSLGTTTYDFGGSVDKAGPFEVSLVVDANGTPASMGKNIGIRFANPSAGWAGVDNVRLLVEITSLLKSATRNDVSPATNDLGADAAIIYPNPVEDVLNIIASSDVTHIEIFNISGKLVKRAQLNGSPVNVSELTNGIYIVKLIGSTTTISKFIK